MNIRPKSIERKSLFERLFGIQRLFDNVNIPS